MRTLTTILTLIILLTGCYNKERKDRQTIRTNDKQTFIVVDYHQNGTIKEVLTTNPDTTQAVRAVYDSSGTLLFTAILKDNIQTHAIEYYPNGRPRGLVNFDTTITGDAVYYYDNGQKKSEGRWENLKKVGIWRDYNEHGEIINVDTLR